MAHVCLGEIAGPHGVRGEVRIRSFTARPEDVAAYGPLADEARMRTFDITVTGAVRGAVLARIAGVADRDAAGALRGVRLYVERAKLPQPESGEYYRADLVGLEIIGADGARLGSVAAVQNFGAGDVLEIAPDDGGTFYVSFTLDAVPEVDMTNRRATIDEAFAVRSFGKLRTHRERKSKTDGPGRAPKPADVERRAAR